MRRENKVKNIYLILIVAICFIFSTIAYSAINATINISGDAVARVEADVRITGFKLARTLNANSSYEEFGKEHIVTEIDLVDTTSSITYNLEITNYGTSDVGILDITGLPSGVNYSISNYNLTDKICDDNGNCNGFIKQTYELTLTTTSTYAGNVQLNFDFRTYHNVTYTNITNNNYPTEVIDGGNLSITFTEKIRRVSIIQNNIQTVYYDIINNGQSITINSVTNDIEIKHTPSSALLVSGDINTIGSEVCIKDECFYIISNDGSTVSMLSKYNLHIGYTYNRTKVTALTNPTGLQSSSAIGWFNGYSATNPIIGSIYFNENENYYWETTVSSYPSYVYNSNSVIYNYLESYKSTLTNKGVALSNIRLIDINELVNLGCSITSKTCADSAYSWLYSTSYWTGSASSANGVWNVLRDGSVNENITVLDFGTGDVLEVDTLGATMYGARPVIEIPIDDIAISNTKLESGELDTPGAEVCIGDECFYTISSTDDTVTMLAKYNLYVGNSCTSATSCTAYGVEATGNQNSTMLGYRVGVTNRYGTTSYSQTNYWSDTTSYPSYVYNENSYLYTYMYNYKNHLEQKNITINEIRPITKEELIKLGCSESTDICYTANYSWVYSTSYWTATALDSTHIYFVRNGGTNLDSYEYKGGHGVRPVITISKSLIYK